MIRRRVEDIVWGSWAAKDQATLLFVVEKDRILLIRKKRGLGAGKINGPGGKLEPGEGPEACAVREVEEELGITAIEPEKLGEARFQFIDGYSIHVHIYRSMRFRGTPTETDEAIPIWSALDAIPYDEMWEDDRLWLPHLVEGNRFDGRFVFEGDVMLDYALDVYA